MTDRQKAYLENLQSEHWILLRESALERDGRRCVKCTGIEFLQVHHLVYRTPWESGVLEDVQTLCRKCHRAEHGLGGWELSEFDEAIKGLRGKLNQVERLDQLPGDGQIAVAAGLCETEDDNREIEAFLRDRAGMRIILTSERAWACWLQQRDRETRFKLWPWSQKKRRQLQEMNYVRQTL